MIEEPLRTDVDGTRVTKDVLRVAERVMDTAQSCGVSIPPSSRLAQIYRIFREMWDLPTRSIRPDHPQFAFACEGVRDIFQLDFAIEQLCRPDPPAGFREKLQAAVDDPVLPQARMDDSAGRDAQCELYVAGICAKAGLSPRFAEPDIQCGFETLTYSVAVKRIKNLKRFEGRVRAAMEQAVRAGTPGAALIDLTIALNRANAPVISNESDAQYGTRTKARLSAVAYEHSKKLVEWAKGTTVRGIILLNPIFGTIGARDGQWTLRRWRVIFLPLIKIGAGSSRDFQRDFWPAMHLANGTG